MKKVCSIKLQVTQNILALQTHQLDPTMGEKCACPKFDMLMPQLSYEDGLPCL